VPADSPDKLFSQLFGHPISLAMVIIHNTPSVRRLDAMSDRVKIAPADKLQRRDKIGGNAGYIYADDADFPARIAGNAALMKRLKNVRDEYNTLDQPARMIG
jgi:hypothetical protein